MSANQSVKAWFKALACFSNLFTTYVLPLGKERDREVGIEKERLGKRKAGWGEEIDRSVTCLIPLSLFFW